VDRSDLVLDAQVNQKAGQRGPTDLGKVWFGWREFDYRGAEARIRWTLQFVAGQLAAHDRVGEQRAAGTVGGEGCARCCFARIDSRRKGGVAVEDVDAAVGGDGSFCTKGARGRRERADDDARSS